MMTPEAIDTLRQAVGAIPSQGNTDIARRLYEAHLALDAALEEWNTKQQIDTAK